MVPIPQSNNFLSELEFSTSRSSGPGGQNVNKVNTKVTLRFDIAQSVSLTPEQKEVIVRKLNSRLTKEGVLVISVQEARSQLQNKELAIQKLDELLTKAFTPKKSRKATKPGKVARQKRLKAKKHQSEKKQWRNKAFEK